MTPQPPPLPFHDLQPPRQPPPLPRPKKRARWPWGVFLALPATCFLSVLIGAAISTRTSVPDGAVLKLKLEGPLKDRGSDWLAQLSGKPPLTLPHRPNDLKKA